MTDKVKNVVYGVTGVSGLEVVEHVPIPESVDSMGMVKVVVQLIIGAFTLFKMIKDKK